jgi:hypothetical protein
MATLLTNAPDYRPTVGWVLEQMDKIPVVKLAQLTGVNQRYLYAIKKAEFNEITPKIWEQLITASQQDMDNAWVLAGTENLSIAAGTFNKAQNERLCLGLTGETGFGKSQSAKLYRQKNTDVVYVHCDTEMTKIDFLGAIFRELQTAPQHRGTNAHHGVKNIVATMVSTMKKPLLIIDDAGKLKNSTFRMFQLLFDEAAGRMGFVLLGVPEFKKKVFSHANRGVFCYKEIARRIGWLELGGIYQRDVAAICQKNGVLDPSAISYFCDHVGDFDTLKRMVKAAKSAADKENTTVTREFLAQRVGKSVENYRVSYVLN